MPATPCTPTRLLASLNLFGLGHLDPVILAALADERDRSWDRPLALDR